MTTPDDPLRGDVESLIVRRLVALLHRTAHVHLLAAFFAGAARGRAEAVDRGPWGGAA